MKPTKRSAIVMGICCLFYASGSATAAPDVVASIKPVHSLVSAVMAGVGEPHLLMPSAGSPHTFQLKPSGARLLESADVIFWMGPALESFFAKALRAIPRKARVTSLYDAPNVSLLTSNDGPIRHASEKSNETHGSAVNRNHAEIDMHAWLDPENARAMATHIAATLIALDPPHTGIYQANADALDLKLAALDQALRETLGSISDRPYFVYHDAYRYFEYRYGLQHQEAITANPHRQPGAERLRRVKKQIIELENVCIFVEPQFRPALVAAITEGTDAKIEILDPLGAELEPGPDLYFALLEGLADHLVRCLTPSP